MIKIRAKIGIGVAFLFLSYIIALFLNGVVKEGTSLYLYESIGSSVNNSKETIVIGIALWLLPKLLMSIYLADIIFRNYKNTYAYYYVRSRTSKVWLRKAFVQLGLSALLFSLLKLIMVTLLDPSLVYIQMAILELVCIYFFALLTFFVLLFTNDEKMAVLVILVVILCASTIAGSGNEIWIQKVFLYHDAISSCALIVILCILSGILINRILKHKEFYY